MLRLDGQAARLARADRRRLHHAVPVRPRHGQAWNPAVQAWSEANLKRFAYEWNRYFRGELPVKDDTDVTEDDVRRCNLILFGDPGSNSLDRQGAAAICRSDLDARRTARSAGALSPRPITPRC